MPRLNYPIVFTGDDVARSAFGVMGISTCFVVGGGDANHEKQVKMIEQALAAK